MQGGSRRRLLVLGAGPGQLGLLEAARERDLHVIAVDRDPGAPGFRLADRRAIVSAEDEPAIDRLAGAEQVHGIVAPGIDAAVAIAARVAAHHNVPHPLEPAVAQLATSKLRQRERLAEAGVPTAPYRVCASRTDVREAAIALGLPVVVKPPDRQGQRGLSAATEAASLEAAFDLAAGATRGSAVLVERLLAGRELTVSGFSIDGVFHALTVTDRITADPPAFGVALAHVWPSDQPEQLVAEAVALARAAAEAIGVRAGPTYTQVLVSEGRLVVGEIAARLGAGHDADLCEAATGVDLAGLTIAAALGDEIVVDDLRPRARVGGACVRFLVAPAGTIDCVEGIDAAAAAPGIAWVRTHRRAGDDVAPLRYASDRAGAVLATGSSRGDALARGEVAAGRVRFRPVVDLYAAAESR